MGTKKKQHEATDTEIDLNELKTELSYDKPVTELNSEVIEAICHVIRLGNFRYVARQSLGIPSYYFSQWIKKGNVERDAIFAGKIAPEDATVYYWLVSSMDKAEASVHAKLVFDVAYCSDPKVKLDFMRRRWGKLYNNNSNVSVDDETGEEVEIDVATLLREKLAAFVDEE